MSNATSFTWPGALVDCVVLVVAFLAARTGVISNGMFTGLLCAIAGARITLLRNGGKGVVGNSAVLLLATGIAAAAGYRHYLPSA